MANGPNGNVVSAPSFKISVNTLQGVPVSEIKDISAQVEGHEYIFNEADGSTRYTKQLGKRKPPEVKLTIPFSPDTFPKIWAWYEAAFKGEPSAFADAELQIKQPFGSGWMTYTLINAWLSKIDVSLPKAGATETGQVNVVIMCDEILLPPG